MQIQPAPVPLSNTGAETAGKSQGTPAVTKADTPRPVDAAPKDPPPRFPYPDPNRGREVDIEA